MNLTFRQYIFLCPGIISERFMNNDNHDNILTIIIIFFIFTSQKHQINLKT